MKKLFTLLILLCAVVTANADDWYVAGQEELTGSSWQMNDDTKMTETYSGSGIFVWQHTVVTGGSYQFKINNGKWKNEGGEEYPSANYYFNDIPDNTTVTIKFDSTTHEILALTEDPEGHPTYVVVKSDVQPYIHAWCSGSGRDVNLSSTGWPGIQMDEVTINGETFYKAGPFYSTWAVFDKIKFIISNNGANQSGTIEVHGDWAYTYACTYNSSDGSSVQLPTVRGDMFANDWQVGVPMTYVSDNTYTVNCTAQWPGALYKIGFTDDFGYVKLYGYGSESSNITTPGNYTLSTSGNNMAIRLQRPVTLTYNSSTKNLNVDYDDDDLSLDYFTTYGDATYDPTTSHDVTTTNEWSGISIDLGSSSTLSAPYLVVTKSDTDQQLYIYVEDTDGKKINDKTFDATSTVCILPLDDTKCIKQVHLKNPAAGTLKLTDCYVTSAATIAAPAEAISGTQYLTYGNLSDAVSFALEDDVTVYTVTYDAAVGCTRKHDVASKEVPAGAAVVLFKEATFTEALTLPVLKGAANLGVNDLKVSDGNVQGAEDIFCLSNGAKGLGFYPVDSSIKVPANKAYLELNLGKQGAPAYVWFNGETTGIDALGNGEATAEKAGAIYTLDGRRVNGNLSQGLYIQNGKKFVVK